MLSAHAGMIPTRCLAVARSAVFAGAFLSRCATVSPLPPLVRGGSRTRARSLQKHVLCSGRKGFNEDKTAAIGPCAPKPGGENFD